MNVQARNARTHLIRLIHVARRDLDMADDTYRTLVAQLAAGKTSSADCTIPELERIIDHLKKAGFKVRKPKAVKPTETRALATDARIIGVNNRDLAIFKTDLALSERLIPLFPADVIAVSESGMVTAADSARAKAAGAHAILVGETLMRAADTGAVLDDLARAAP